MLDQIATRRLRMGFNVGGDPYIDDHHTVGRYRPGPRRRAPGWPMATSAASSRFGFVLPMDGGVSPACALDISGWLRWSIRRTSPISASAIRAPNGGTLLPLCSPYTMAVTLHLKTKGKNDLPPRERPFPKPLAVRAAPGRSAVRAMPCHLPKGAVNEMLGDHLIPAAPAPHPGREIGDWPPRL